MSGREKREEEWVARCRRLKGRVGVVLEGGTKKRQEGREREEEGEANAKKEEREE